jgi:hypothetical protein
LALGQQPTGTAIKVHSTPSLLIYLLLIPQPHLLNSWARLSTAKGETRGPRSRSSLARQRRI